MDFDDRLRGREPQLDKAIEQIMSELEGSTEN